MEKTQSKTERLKELASKYGLIGEDFHKVHNSVIVTRTGVEKIQTVERINIRYEMVSLDLDKSHCCIKAIATSENLGTVESYGESVPKNTKAPYPVAMAEKRAKARAILQLTEFYQLGVYSEDESDDFKKPNLDV